MTQTWAVFVDAYRELNSKKLFWIVMILSALVVLAFACVGLSPTGITVLWWDFKSPINGSVLSTASFYRFVFQSFGVKFWLGWISTILALVATCGLMPEFVSSGSIELTLSKPIGRTRMFLTKFAAGLLFTFMQVSVFSVAVLLVIGLRGHEWDFRVLLAVPIVTIFYSYLFCLCTLVGLVTRSAIFSLVATLVLWIGIFAIHAVESGLFLGLEVAAETRVQRLEKQLEHAQNTETPKPEKAAGSGLTGAFLNALSPKSDEAQVQRIRKDLEAAREDEARWVYWHNVAFAIKTILPKTTETTEYLTRVLITEDELAKLDPNEESREGRHAARREARAAARAAAVEHAKEANEPPPPPPPTLLDLSDEDASSIGREMAKRLHDRSVAWVIGTSLGFEAVVLALACWIFRRRDF